VACNSPLFRDKILNSALRFIDWTPGKARPNHMTVDHLPLVRMRTLLFYKIGKCRKKKKEK
jgi:hypothetical protein